MAVQRETRTRRAVQFFRVFVVGISDMDRPKGKEEDRVPKEFEGIHLWVEYSMSKTWLLEAS